MQTSAPATRIALTADSERIRGDGEDLVFVTATALDAEGRFCPRANDTVSFVVKGPVGLRGVGSGDQSSVESFLATKRRLFNGLCLAIVEADKGARSVLTLTASAAGLETARIKLTTGGE